MPQATAYFARAGSVVKVSLGGMRMPSAPICPPEGVANSVPRLLPVNVYLLTPKSKRRVCFGWQCRRNVVNLVARVIPHNHWHAHLLQIRC